MIFINIYIYTYCSVILATNFCEWCPHLRQICSYIDSHVSHIFLSVPIVSLFVVGWCWLIAPASPWGTSRRGTRCRPKWPAPRTCRSWNMKHPLQGGAPQVISWFVIPLTIDISPINHSYWSYLHQLSYRTGAPPCINHGFIGDGIAMNHIFGTIAREFWSSWGWDIQSERSPFSCPMGLSGPHSWQGVVALTHWLILAPASGYRLHGSSWIEEYPECTLHKVNSDAMDPDAMNLGKICPWDPSWVVCLRFHHWIIEVGFIPMISWSHRSHHFFLLSSSFLAIIPIICVICSLFVRAIS